MTKEKFIERWGQDPPTDKILSDDLDKLINHYYFEMVGSGQPPKPEPQPITLPMAQEWAKWLHQNYEEIAAANGWETQKSTQVEFNLLPFRNKVTMLELGARLRSELEKRMKGGEGQ